MIHFAAASIAAVLNARAALASPGGVRILQGRVGRMPWVACASGRCGMHDGNDAGSRISVGLDCPARVGAAHRHDRAAGRPRLRGRRMSIMRYRAMIAAARLAPLGPPAPETQLRLGLELLAPPPRPFQRSVVPRQLARTRCNVVRWGRAVSPAGEDQAAAFAQARRAGAGAVPMRPARTPCNVVRWGWAVSPAGEDGPAFAQARRAGAGAVPMRPARTLCNVVRWGRAASPAGEDEPAFAQARRAGAGAVPMRPARTPCNVVRWGRAVGPAAWDRPATFAGRGARARGRCGGDALGPVVTWCGGDGRSGRPGRTGRRPSPGRGARAPERRRQDPHGPVVTWCGGDGRSGRPGRIGRPSPGRDARARERFRGVPHKLHVTWCGGGRAGQDLVDGGPWPTSRRPFATRPGGHNHRATLTPQSCVSIERGISGRRPIPCARRATCSD